LPGLRYRRDERALAPRGSYPVGGLTARIKFPVPRRLLIWRVEDRLLEKALAHLFFPRGQVWRGPARSASLPARADKVIRNPGISQEPGAARARAQLSEPPPVGNMLGYRRRRLRSQPSGCPSEIRQEL